MQWRYFIFYFLGSWSSSNASKNNVVNAFSYYANDTILVSYEPEEQKIVFKKKGTEETHTLEYEPVEGDELHFCGLFYYSNDEIEFIGHADEVEVDWLFVSLTIKNCIWFLTTQISSLIIQIFSITTCFLINYAYK